MQTPSVNAVGLLEVPPDYEGEPRTYSRATRLMAWLFILFFTVVTVASTVLSLGAYCLTSHGGDTRALRSSPLLPDVERAAAAATAPVAEPDAESSVTAANVR